jgi:DNA-binding CsgD family transcriptional regulator
VFPGHFTLEAAEAVAGPDTSPVVLRLVDCSLLVPPQAGPDGRLRYVMLETLRTYGAALLAQAGEQEQAAAALAGYALRVAEQSAVALQTGTGEVTAGRRLDAEDAMMRQVLAWAMQHNSATALRLTIALAPWWMLRGRLVSQRSLLREATGHAPAGSDRWCTAHYWLGLASLYSADLAGALDHFTEVRDAIGDRPSSRPLIDCLRCRSAALANMGRVVEAADDARRSLALARELDYLAGEAMALGHLAVAVFRAGDLGGAVQLARQGEQIRADIPGWIARLQSNFLTIVLTEAGELAAANRACMASLVRAREADDQWNQARLLVQMATLDLLAARTEEAAAHLRDSLLIAARTGDQFELRNALDCCGHLCAATGRYAEAVTVWAAHTAIFRQEGYAYPPAEAGRKEDFLRKARQALGFSRARAAENRGTAMSPATAAEYALMLTSAGSPQVVPLRPTKLSARERELVTLVAQGRTNAQIAAQLYISVRTVGSHLDRIRDKTGCRRRADLTRLALSEGLV